MHVGDAAGSSVCSIDGLYWMPAQMAEGVQAASGAGRGEKPDQAQAPRINWRSKSGLMDCLVEGNGIGSFLE
jgi:hypothetical protein